MTPEQIVFLVGGRGTRLGALTQTLPKPLLEVGGRPFLDLLIENAMGFGFRKVLLLAGHLGDEIAARYRDWGAGRGLTIDCLIEPEAAGTGGALRYAADRLDQSFLLCNGDTFFDIDLRDLQTVPAGPDCVGRMALRRVEDGSRYGGVILDGSLVRGFAARGTPGPALINGGIYLLGRSVLDWVERLPCSIEADVFPRLAEDGLLAGRVYDRFFIDIGVPEDFARAQREVPCHVRGPVAGNDLQGA